MTGIFISYSQKDKSKAAAMAAALEQAGLTVWWDNDLLPGDRLAATLAERIDSTLAVVVMWSETSITSDYVCDEADRARIAGSLTPVLINHVRSPVGFGQLHPHDLTSWSGAADDPALLEFVAHLSPNAPATGQTPVAAPPPAPKSRPFWPAAAAVAFVTTGVYFAG